MCLWHVDRLLSEVFRCTHKPGLCRHRAPHSLPESLSTLPKLVPSIFYKRERGESGAECERGESEGGKRRISGVWYVRRRKTERKEKKRREKRTSSWKMNPVMKNDFQCALKQPSFVSPPPSLSLSQHAALPPLLNLALSYGGRALALPGKPEFTTSCDCICICAKGLVEESSGHPLALRERKRERGNGGGKGGPTQSSTHFEGTHVDWFLQTRRHAKVPPHTHTILWYRQGGLQSFF